ncbi:MAG: PEP-CTERM sorting domain-containing protein [Planctomycetes bacterium]|nr:PEP-CTERM sorting domain-containing protein [Planctomycetota bacterium]
MNKSSVPAMAGVCGVLLLAGTSSADFVMLTVELFANNWNTSDAEFDGNIPDGNLRDVWRVYAHFDDPNDRMTAIGVAIDGTPMTVENVLADGVTRGSGLYEALFGGWGDGGGPIANGTTGWTMNPTGLTFDTYMTIGAEAGYTPVIDPKTGDPFFFGWGLGFLPNWGEGTSWVIDNAAFVTNPAAPYGMPDGNGRVLVAQFNVADGEHIQGFANIQWGNVGLAGGGFVTGVFFTSIPAPGTLALLALAGLAGFRRRRR